MLSNIELSNFKSAKHLSVPLTPLTILSGLNGSGKSSVLQSIALLKQSIDNDKTGHQLFLDGSTVTIGLGGDVLYESAKDDKLSICIKDESEIFTWEGEVKTNKDTISTIFKGNENRLFEIFNGFQFIQANRMVPENQYLQASSKLKEEGSLGSHGEFTVDFLSCNSELKISKKRQYPLKMLKNPVEIALMQAVAPTDYIADVVSAWLQLLSPGARAIATPVELSMRASLKFEYKGFTDAARVSDAKLHRPSNVGFGLTYSLPIIVACISAKPGSIVLLENPEAHLHPRGQSALGLLLALCASDGVQIIVETHSDHLLNGIRLAAKKGYISAEKVAAHFFTREVATGTTSIQSPTLLSNGRFTDWPAGFFDEWESALDDLLDDAE